MTTETPSTAAPARPARSLDGMAPSPGQRRPGEHTASGSRARARTSADPRRARLASDENPLT